MGKQYNKVLKRRRRAAYMTKRKLALRELVKNSPKAKTTKSKVAKPKVARKTVAAKKEKVVERKEKKVLVKTLLFLLPPLVFYKKAHRHYFVCLRA